LEQIRPVLSCAAPPAVVTMQVRLGVGRLFQTILIETQAQA